MKLWVGELQNRPRQPTLAPCIESWSKFTKRHNSEASITCYLTRNFRPVGIFDPRTLSAHGTTHKYYFCSVHISLFQSSSKKWCTPFPRSRACYFRLACFIFVTFLLSESLVRVGTEAVRSAHGQSAVFLYATSKSEQPTLFCPPPFPSPLPHPRKKNWHKLFNFSWEGCNTQEKWKIRGMQNLGGNHKRNEKLDYTSDPKG